MGGHHKSHRLFVVPIFAVAAIFFSYISSPRSEPCCSTYKESLENQLKPRALLKRDFAKLKAAILTSVNKARKTVDVEEIRKAMKGTGPARIILDATWEPKSNEIIDCRGGSILPRKLAAANRGLSEPDTLFFLEEGVHNVQIKNCTLDATFPIVITGGENHHIFQNDIRSYSHAIHLFGGNNVKIERNKIRSTGTLVLINGDSSYTKILDNHINYQAGGPVVEGAPGLTGEGHPGAIGVGMYQYPGVDYMVINDRLIQVIAKADTHPFQTVVRGNAIDMRPGTDFTIGIGFAARSSHSLAERNIIIGAPLGVLGNPDESTYFEPGWCSGEPELRCNPEDGLCEFLDLGNCDKAVEVFGGGRVIAPVMIDNQVSQSDAGLAGGLSDNQLRWERNLLEHNKIGILLFSYALEGATIRGNIAAKNDVGLRIEHDNSSVECPEADISYNDFGDNDQPFEAATLVGNEDDELVEVLPYVMPTTLPNNWWGSKPCGFPKDQEQWPNTVGPSSAAMPIAAAWQAEEAESVPRCDTDVEPLQCEED